MYGLCVRGCTDCGKSENASLVYSALVPLVLGVALLASGYQDGGSETAYSEESYHVGCGTQAESVGVYSTSVALSPPPPTPPLLTPPPPAASTTTCAGCLEGTAGACKQSGGNSSNICVAIAASNVCPPTFAPCVDAAGDADAPGDAAEPASSNPLGGATDPVVADDGADDDDGSCESSYRREREKYSKLTQSEGYAYPYTVVIGYVLCLFIFPIVILICGVCCGCSCEERMECCGQARSNFESNTGFSFSSSSSI